MSPSSRLLIIPFQPTGPRGIGAAAKFCWYRVYDGSGGIGCGIASDVGGGGDGGGDGVGGHPLMLLCRWGIGPPICDDGRLSMRIMSGQ
jgi:hypothetical protein